MAAQATKALGQITKAVQPLVTKASGVTSGATAFMRSPTFKTAIAELGPPMKLDVKALTAGAQEFKAGVMGIGGMTMRELGVKALVCFEVACWFTAGTVIGRGQLRGYGYPQEHH